MGRKAPKPPAEDDAVVSARNRQVMDLAKEDEELNRRVKQMRTVSRGVRAFRGVRSTATAARNRSAIGGAAQASDTGGGAYEAQMSLLNHFMSGGQ